MAPTGVVGNLRPTGRSDRARTITAIIGSVLFRLPEREEASRCLGPNTKRQRGGPHYLYYPNLLN